MSKLEKFFNTWFEGNGFVSVARITGVSFPSFADVEESMILAKRQWDNSTIRYKLRSYQSIGFADHLNTSQTDFIRANWKGGSTNISAEPSHDKVTQ